jgi:probable F420-dependent oxidoreductase
MKYGVSLFPTAQGIHPAELARLAEGHGFESLFFPEHTHIPAVSQATFPWGDGTVPQYYRETFDPFIALTAAASSTSRIQLGTGICLITQRDPITTAKEVATLDHLSHGRVLFGVGAGWNLYEMANHGTDPSTRFSLMRERIEAMKELWSDEEEASYHGRFVDFDRVWAWPKPYQRTCPPILIAGNGPKALDRVLIFGDEWLPEPEPGLVERITELKRRAELIGRPEVDVTVYSARVEELDLYKQAGAHRCVFWIPPNDEQAARHRLEELARILHL